VVIFHKDLRNDKEARKRRDYTEDFKRDAVVLVTEQGYKPSEAARSLGVGTT
jgi:transposase